MEFKTTPFSHQLAVYEAKRDALFYALFWEMGLGKSKVILDVASHLHERSQIQALVIVAPNSVYKNWIGQELPAHLATKSIAMAYPKRASRRDSAKRLIFLDPSFEPNCLRVIAISYDSICTEQGYEYISKLMKIYDTMLVADESTAIKTPSAVRTKRVKSLGKLALRKWICTGTPVAQSPFDVHSQIDFICPEFWQNHGLRSYSAFKNEFGEFTQRRISGGRQFPELQSYRRLDYLQKILTSISSRLLKEDSEVKLPPKMYSLRTFELTDDQRSIYDQLKTEFIADMDGGAILEAPLAIVRLARLQQITSGFVSVDVVTGAGELTLEDDEPVMIVNTERNLRNIVEPDDNPRLQLLLGVLSEVSHKVIVWCRFRRDVDNVVGALGSRCVRYDGSVSGKDREIALDRFRDPSDSAQFFVANIQAISDGVTLTIAKTMVYYTNSFSLEKRLQSEDRFHRIGQDQSVLIIDLAAEDTVDHHVIDSLRKKFNIAAAVTGDRMRAWL